ncbi:MAG: GNAT family N-acetyltransferase [Proteobacteria bacterium]|nr:GNAT family N-acetyltransferase [Pseudomonadota bacterium]
MSTADSFLSAHQDKLITAEAAARLIKPGQRVFVGTACATPRALLDALEALAQPPANVQLNYFLTTNALKRDADNRVKTHYRHRVFFVGSDVREAVKQGAAEYVPISIARVPQLIRIGRIPIDVALIQVSAPDEFGYVSLGVSVDIVAAAVEQAKLVIAEVNPAMPRTMGDSTMHVNRIHKLVPVESPVIEYVHATVEDEVVQRIARYIAGIIDDGSTLQVGLGRIPNESLKYLDDRRDLGIHSDVITDAIIPLLEKGILTGRQKTERRGKIVTGFALGTRRLYDLLDRNPLFSFQPMEAICNPYTLSKQHKLVSVTQAFAIDLTGQVCSDQFDGEFYGGLAAQSEFLQGAARSPGGKPIICLTSTTDDGETSRVRPLLLAGEGVSVARTDVHYVITEYGIAYLFGKSIGERAVALIEIAHPKFRAQLLEEAKRLGYLPADQSLKSMRDYPVEEERVVKLKNGRQIMLRPARASDADGIRALFHSMPADDVYTRFFHRLHSLSNREVARLCNLNYETEVAFVAVEGPRENEQVVAQSCYFINPSTNLAETAFMVDPAWQGTGLGSALQRRMAEHARARGLRGFIAEVLPENSKMLALARGFSNNIHVERDEDTVHVTMLF